MFNVNVNALPLLESNEFMFVSKEGEKYKLNNKKTVDVLLQAMGVDCEDKYGLTALYLAVDHNHFDVASYLITKGANVNFCLRDGILHNASKKGYSDMVKLLIENGAEINKKDKGGWTALNYSNSSKHEEVSQYLKKKVQLLIYVMILCWNCIMHLKEEI